MLKRVLIGLGVILGFFFVIVLMQPSQYTVSRSMVMHAPAEAIFTEINDLKKMKNWSPWTKADPLARIEFGSSSEGVGGNISWEGNAHIGAGKMTIVHSEPPERVALNIEFLKPIRSNATAEFILKTEGEDTLVIWTMTSEANFLAKLRGLLFDMNHVLGSDFEMGLVTLKTRVEMAPKAPSAQ